MHTKFTIGDRYSGKTSKLIKRSAEEGSYILCPNKRMASYIFKQAKKMGLDIPYPVTLGDELSRNENIREKGILIDELDIILSGIFNGIPIREATITNHHDSVSYLNNPTIPELRVDGKTKTF